MFKTIKSKFIFFSVFLILLTTALPMYFLVKQLRSNFQDRSVIMLDTTLDIIRFALKSAMLTGHKENLQNVIEDLSEKEGIYHIRIFDKDGVIKFASQPDQINKNIFVIAPHHSNLDAMDTKVITLESGDEIYSSTEPILNEKPCMSCHKEKDIIAYLDIDTNLTIPENKFYTGTVHMIFLGWAVIFLLFMGLYIIFNRFINSPLQKIVSALDDVEGGNLNVRLNVNRNDEIGIVNRHFNAMSSKLRSSNDAIKQLHLKELQRVDRLKTLGELTSQTAHELNNHIAIIMSRVDYLNLESSKNSELLKYSEDFNVLMDQSSKISDINRNILRYSKKDTIDFEEIDLVNIVNSFVKIYKALLLKRDIILNTKINIFNAIIMGNSVQINQILTNLVNNAADALDDKGEIIITLSQHSGNKIVLDITDNGPGISNEIMDAIYSPFFTTKTNKENTGLGLYIVKKICEQHNAEIVCNSELNAGTSFKITFNKR